MYIKVFTPLNKPFRLLTEAHQNEGLAARIRYDQHEGLLSRGHYFIRYTCSTRAYNKDFCYVDPCLKKCYIITRNLDFNGLDRFRLEF